MNSAKIYTHPEGGYVIDLPAASLQFTLKAPASVKLSSIDSETLKGYEPAFWGGDIVSIIQNALLENNASSGQLGVLIALAEEKNEDGDGGAE